MANLDRSMKSSCFLETLNENWSVFEHTRRVEISCRMSIVSRAAFFFASGSLTTGPAGMGGIFCYKDWELKRLVRLRCCCYMEQKKQVASLEVLAALYLGGYISAVERQRLEANIYGVCFASITSAPPFHTSLPNAAAVASRWPHFPHSVSIGSRARRQAKTQGAGSL